MGEDVNSVSPTLGFIIKTIDYEGQVSQITRAVLTANFDVKIQAEHMYVQIFGFLKYHDSCVEYRGCRRTEDLAIILEKLL